MEKEHDVMLLLNDQDRDNDQTPTNETTSTASCDTTEIQHSTSAEQLHTSLPENYVRTKRGSFSLQTSTDSLLQQLMNKSSASTRPHGSPYVDHSGASAAHSGRTSTSNVLPPYLPQQSSSQAPTWEARSEVRIEDLLQDYHYNTAGVSQLDLQSSLPMNPYSRTSHLLHLPDSQYSNGQQRRSRSLPPAHSLSTSNLNIDRYPSNLSPTPRQLVDMHFRSISPASQHSLLQSSTLGSSRSGTTSVLHHPTEYTFEVGQGTLAGSHSHLLQPPGGGRGGVSPSRYCSRTYSHSPSLELGGMGPGASPRATMNLSNSIDPPVIMPEGYRPHSGRHLHASPSPSMRIPSPQQAMHRISTTPSPRLPSPRSAISMGNEPGSEAAPLPKLQAQANADNDAKQQFLRKKMEFELKKRNLDSEARDWRNFKRATPSLTTLSNTTANPSPVPSTATTNTTRDNPSATDFFLPPRSHSRDLFGTFPSAGTSRNISPFSQLSSAQTQTLASTTPADTPNNFGESDGFVFHEHSPYPGLRKQPSPLPPVSNLPPASTYNYYAPRTSVSTYSNTLGLPDNLFSTNTTTTARAMSPLYSHGSFPTLVQPETTQFISTATVSTPVALVGSTLLLPVNLLSSSTGSNAPTFTSVASSQPQPEQPRRRSSSLKDAPPTLVDDAQSSNPTPQPPNASSSSSLSHTPEPPAHNPTTAYLNASPLPQAPQAHTPVPKIPPQPSSSTETTNPIESTVKPTEVVQTSTSNDTTQKFTTSPNVTTENIEIKTVNNSTETPVSTSFTKGPDYSTASAIHTPDRPHAQTALRPSTSVTCITTTEEQTVTITERHTTLPLSPLSGAITGSPTPQKSTTTTTLITTTPPKTVTTQLKTSPNTPPKTSPIRENLQTSPPDTHRLPKLERLEPIPILRMEEDIGTASPFSLSTISKFDTISKASECTPLMNELSPRTLMSTGIAEHSTFTPTSATTATSELSPPSVPAVPIQPIIVSPRTMHRERSSYKGIPQTMLALLGYITPLKMLSEHDFGHYSISQRILAFEHVSIIFQPLLSAWIPPMVASNPFNMGNAKNVIRELLGIMENVDKQNKHKGVKLEASAEQCGVVGKCVQCDTTNVILIIGDASGGPSLAASLVSCVLMSQYRCTITDIHTSGTRLNLNPNCTLRHGLCLHPIYIYLPTVQNLFEKDALKKHLMKEYFIRDAGDWQQFMEYPIMLVLDGLDRVTGMENWVREATETWCKPCNADTNRRDFITLNDLDRFAHLTLVLTMSDVNQFDEETEQINLDQFFQSSERTVVHQYWITPFNVDNHTLGASINTHALHKQMIQSSQSKVATMTFPDLSQPITTQSDLLCIRELSAVQQSTAQLAVTDELIETIRIVPGLKRLIHGGFTLNNIMQSQHIIRQHHNLQQLKEENSNNINKMTYYDVVKLIYANHQLADSAVAFDTLNSFFDETVFAEQGVQSTYPTIHRDSVWEVCMYVAVLMQKHQTREWNILDFVTTVQTQFRRQSEEVNASPVSHGRSLLDKLPLILSTIASFSNQENVVASVTKLLGGIPVFKTINCEQLLVDWSPISLASPSASLARHTPLPDRVIFGFVHRDIQDFFIAEAIRRQPVLLQEIEIVRNELITMFLKESTYSVVPAKIGNVCSQAVWVQMLVDLIQNSDFSAVDGRISPSGSPMAALKTGREVVLRGTRGAFTILSKLSRQPSGATALTRNRSLCNVEVNGANLKGGLWINCTFDGSTFQNTLFDYSTIHACSFENVTMQNVGFGVRPTLLTTHQKVITRAEFIGNSHLATTSMGGTTICMTNVFTGTHQEIQCDPRVPINLLAVSNDGKFLAISHGQAVKILQVDVKQNGEVMATEIRTFVVEGILTCIAFDKSDFNVIASSHTDDKQRSMVYIFGITPEFTRKLESLGVINCLTVDTMGVIISGSDDHRIRLWNVASPAGASPSRQFQIQNLLDTHSPKKILHTTSNDHLFSVGFNSSLINIWNRIDLKITTQIQTNHVVADIALTRDNVSLLTSAEDSSIIRVWLWRDDQVLLYSFDGKEHIPTFLTVTPDNRFIVSTAAAETTIKLWKRKAKPVLPTTYESHYNNINSLQLTNDDKYIVSTALDNTLRITDLETGNTTRSIQIDKDNNQQSPKSHLSIIPTESSPRYSECGHGLVVCVAVTADNKHCAVGLADGRIQLIDVVAGNVLTVFEVDGHTGPVYSVAISSNHIVSGGKDGTIRIWYMPSAQLLIPPIVGHTDTIASLGISSEDENGFQVVSGSHDCTVRIWDIGPTTSNNAFVLHGHKDKVTSVAVDKRKALCASGPYIASGGFDGNIMVWDRHSKQELMTLQPGEGIIWNLVLNNDMVVAACQSNVVLVWYINYGNNNCVSPINRLVGHCNPVNCVALNMNNTKIVSTSGEGTVRIWHAIQRKENNLTTTEEWALQDMMNEPENCNSNEWKQFIRCNNHMEDPNLIQLNTEASDKWVVDLFDAMKMECFTRLM